MKKIVAFGASSSRQSINKKLATWAANQLTDVEINILDLNDFEMPIFSVDRLQEDGIPQKSQEFRNLLQQADGIIISFAEHNGAYSAAFKNIFDWFSRIEQPIWMNKPMLLLATSPGGRGGQSVLSTAVTALPHQGANVTGSFSLPSFHSNFDGQQGITNSQLMESFGTQLSQFEQSL